MRLGEYKTTVETENEHNSLFQHVKNQNHPIDWIISHVNYDSGNEGNRLLVKSTLIIAPKTFNIAKGDISVENLSNAIILKSLPHLGMQRAEASTRNHGSSHE